LGVPKRVEPWLRPVQRVSWAWAIFACDLYYTFHWSKCCLVWNAVEIHHRRHHHFILTQVNTISGGARGLRGGAVAPGGHLQPLTT